GVAKVNALVFSIDCRLSRLVRGPSHTCATEIRMNITLLLLLLVSMIQCLLAASLWEAYNSEAQQRRREGMKATRFRPVLLLRGEDDFRTELGDDDSSVIEDEDGIIISERNWKSHPQAKIRRIN
ncbi:hypothetical protein PMAYCL1PPCAC_00015, partial [Pristionchus mayeri]